MRYFLSVLMGLLVIVFAFSQTEASKVADWPLDINGNDVSGNNYNGTIVGSPIFVAGIAGQSLGFDGVDDVVDCGNPAGLNSGMLGAGSSFSIEAWFKLDTSPSYGYYIVNKRGYAGNYIGYAICYITGGKIEVELECDPGGPSYKLIHDSTASITDTNWHHVVAVVDRSVPGSYYLLLYIDGRLDSSASINNVSGSLASVTKVSIGARDQGASRDSFFKSAIDEVRIYNNVENSSDIATRYDKTKFPWVDVRAYNSFSVAIDAIGTSKATLLIPNEQAVTANKTVPSNITLAFLQGGFLNISAGVTVTINGPIEAGLYRVFTGSGIVSLGDNVCDIPKAAWWGLDASASAATNSAAIEAANDASIYGGLVYAHQGTFNINATTLQSSAPNEYVSKAWGLIGNGERRTIFQYNGTGTAFTFTNSAASVNYAFAKDFGVYQSGGVVQGKGIDIGNATYVVVKGHFENIECYGFWSGWQLTSVGSCTFINCYGIAGTYGWYFPPGANTNQYCNLFLSCIARINSEYGFYINSGDENTFVNILSEANSKEGVVINEATGAYADTPYGFTFIGGKINESWYGNRAGGGKYDLKISSEKGASYTGPYRIRFIGTQIPGDVNNSLPGFNVSEGMDIHFDGCYIGGNAASLLGANTKHCRVELIDDISYAAGPITDNGVGNIVTWANVESALSAYPSAVQNIPVGSDFQISFATEEFDRNGDWSTNVFVAPVTGEYIITVSIVLGTLNTQTTTTYDVKLLTQTSGDVTKRNYTHTYKFKSSDDTVSFSDVVDLNKTDKVKVFVRQNGGTAQAQVQVGSRITGKLLK